MAAKACFKCLVVQTMESFYAHKAMKDGHLNKCKTCAKSDVRDNRAANDDQYRAFDRARAKNPDRVAGRMAYQQTDAFRVSHNKACRKWDANNPIRKAAQSAVHNALRDGRLQKQPCHLCGAEKAQGHHPDYSRPLDVVWLCTAHHSQVHNEFYWHTNPLSVAAA